MDELALVQNIEFPNMPIRTIHGFGKRNQPDVRLIGY